MTFLLDTHIFIWMIEGNPVLRPAQVKFIEDSANEPLVSIASLWEMAIKTGLGKLQLELSFEELIQQNITSKRLRIVHITPAHLDTYTALPLHHRNPFDRLIISQALAKNLPVMAVDSVFETYGVELV